MVIKRPIGGTFSEEAKAEYIEKLGNAGHAIVYIDKMGYDLTSDEWFQVWKSAFDEKKGEITAQEGSRIRRDIVRPYYQKSDQYLVDRGLYKPVSLLPMECDCDEEHCSWPCSRDGHWDQDFEHGGSNIRLNI